MSSRSLSGLRVQVSWAVSCICSSLCRSYVRGECLPPRAREGIDEIGAVPVAQADDCAASTAAGELRPQRAVGAGEADQDVQFIGGNFEALQHTVVGAHRVTKYGEAAGRDGALRFRDKCGDLVEQRLAGRGVGLPPPAQ